MLVVHTARLGICAALIQPRVDGGHGVPITKRTPAISATRERLGARRSRRGGGRGVGVGQWLQELTWSPGFSTGRRPSSTSNAWWPGLAAALYATRFHPRSHPPSRCIRLCVAVIHTQLLYRRRSCEASCYTPSIPWLVSTVGRNSRSVRRCPSPSAAGPGRGRLLLEPADRWRRGITGSMTWSAIRIRPARRRHPGDVWHARVRDRGSRECGNSGLSVGVTTYVR